MEGRPWHALYDAHLDPELDVEFADGLSLFRAAAVRVPDAPLVRYFDATLTVAEVESLSDGLAAALAVRGLRAGDRVALYLQNVPQFVLALLAAWKAGAIAVPVNP